jgi:hypothetical protein
MSLALWSSDCGHRAESRTTPLSLDEKHRLYSAALATSEAPLDTDTFKDVCQRIGIFDASGKPNDQYMAFVSQHVDWGTRPDTNQFRQEINSKDKAREYIKQHLSAQ